MQNRESKEAICAITKKTFFLTKLYFVLHLRHLLDDEPRLRWQTGTSRES